MIFTDALHDKKSEKRVAMKFFDNPRGLHLKQNDNYMHACYQPYTSLYIANWLAINHILYTQPTLLN